MILRIFAFFFVSVALMVVEVCGQDYVGTCQVRFEGSSNLHDFSGTVNGVPIQAQRRGDVFEMESQVTIGGMRTGNEKRDKRMWQMFEKVRYPLLVLRVKRASVEEARPNEGAGCVLVEMEVRGKRVPVEAAITNLKEGKEQVTFDVSMQLSLKALGLIAPKALLGTVQVKDKVRVLSRVSLKEKS